MLCKCKQTCTTRLDSGQVLYVLPGETHEFEVCPPHFEEVRVSGMGAEIPDPEALSKIQQAVVKAKKAEGLKS